MPKDDRTLSGAHVAAMFVTGFSVIVGVNIALAVNAVRTFPGLETDSSYVASQSFEADRAAQEALDWDVTVTAGPVLTLSVRGPEGRAVRPRIVSATLGRATTLADDMSPAFAWTGSDHVAPVALSRGNWNLRLEAEAPDGTPFRRRIVIRVP